MLSRTPTLETARTSSRRWRAARSAHSKGKANGRRASRAALLENVIDEERLRLLRAHSLLRCTSIAMEHGSDDEDEAPGPYFPALIELAAELIHETGSTGPLRRGPESLLAC